MKAVIFNSASDFKKHKDVVVCSALKFSKNAHKAKVKAEYDVILVTSQQVFKFLKKWPKAKTMVLIGLKTAEASKRHPKKVILKDSSSEGVLKYFKNKKPLNIYFPRSILGNPKTVRKLRSYGHRVTEHKVYKVSLCSIRRSLTKILEQKVDAFFITSPSVVSALQNSFSRADLRAMPVKWIAIGETTRKAVLNGLKIRPLTARKPTLKCMFNLIRAK